VVAKFPALGATNQRYLKLGLIGHPVSHSISPLLHGAAMSFSGLPGEYNLIDVEPEHLEQRLAELVADGYVGLNVTIPHKQAVLKLMDDLTDEARKVQAVNTISITGGGKLIGHNTDLGGFTESLREFMPGSLASATGHNAVIMGAGGAARAALFGLLDLGWKEIAVVARNVFQAQALREQVLEHDPQLKTSRHIIVLEPDALADRHPTLIVNSTPVGLSDLSIPRWMDDLISQPAPGGGFGYMYDLVYSGKQRKTTPLVEAATRAGRLSMDGSQMLLLQALQAFQTWTGVKVPSQAASGILCQ
jgi:shikimate dehydrogenase